MLSSFFIPLDKLTCRGYNKYKEKVEIKMEKEDVLAKSRSENKNTDFYELEVNQKGYRIASYISVFLVLLFLFIEIGIGLGINYGLQAIIFTLNFCLFAVRGYYLRKKAEIISAIAFGILAILTTYTHISNLMTLAQ